MTDSREYLRNKCEETSAVEWEMVGGGWVGRGTSVGWVNGEGGGGGG